MQQSTQLQRLSLIPDTCCFGANFNQHRAVFAPAQLVIEVVATENVEFEVLDLSSAFLQFVLQRTILATNTSSISITLIAAQTARPDRVMGMIGMNPVPVMKFRLS